MLITEKDVERFQMLGKIGLFDLEEVNSKVLAERKKDSSPEGDSKVDADGADDKPGDEKDEIELAPNEPGDDLNDEVLTKGKKNKTKSSAINVCSFFVGGICFSFSLSSQDQTENLRSISRAPFPPSPLRSP